MAELLINSAITHGLMFVLPIICALLARWLRCPGAGVVGGAIAGVLIGPTIFGRLAPDTFELRFMGGVAERSARDVVVRRHDVESILARETARDVAAITEMQARHSAELAEAEHALAAAQWKAQRPLRSYAAVMVSLTLLGGAVLRGPRAGPGATRPDLVAVSSIGGWAAVLPGAITFGALRWFADLDPAEAALAAAAVAVGPWMLTPVDRTAADLAEIGGARLIETAGRVSSMLALAVAAGALAATLGLRGFVWFAPLLALPLGWVLPRVVEARLLRLVLDGILVPCLAACVAMRVDLIIDFAPWIVLMLAIVSGDGRWLGAFAGAMIPGGRFTMRTMRLVVGAMACGPTQLAIAAMAALTWSIPRPITYGLLVGAVIMEVTVGARRSMTRRLVAAEQELGE